MMRQFSTTVVLIGRRDSGQFDYQINRQRQYDLTCSPRGCVVAKRNSTDVPIVETSSNLRHPWKERALNWLAVAGLTALGVCFLYFAIQMFAVGVTELDGLRSASVSQNMP